MLVFALFFSVFVKFKGAWPRYLLPLAKLLKYGRWLSDSRFSKHVCLAQANLSVQTNPSQSFSAKKIIRFSLYITSKLQRSIIYLGVNV